MRAAGVPLEGQANFYETLCPQFSLGHAVQWNDIDLYHAYRDFTTDPVSFPADELRAFIQELVSVSPDGLRLVLTLIYKAANHQHCKCACPLSLTGLIEGLSDIPIVDAGIAVTVNSTDVVSS
jgi:alpha-glucosidase